MAAAGARPRGVSAAGIAAVIDALGGRDVLAGVCTRDVMPRIAQMAGARAWCNSDVGAPHVAPATVYVVHAHSAVFLDLLDALLKFDEGTPGSFFWVDVLSLPQPAAGAPRAAWKLDDIVARTRATQLTLLVATRAVSEVLTRSWCLAELLLTLLGGGKVACTFGPALATTLREDGVHDFQSVVTATTSIHCATAACGVEEDRARLATLFAATPTADAVLVRCMRQFLIETATGLISSHTPHEGCDAPSSLLRCVASLQQDMYQPSLTGAPDTKAEFVVTFRKLYGDALRAHGAADARTYRAQARFAVSLMCVRDFGQASRVFKAYLTSVRADGPSPAVLEAVGEFVQMTLDRMDPAPAVAALTDVMTTYGEAMGGHPARLAFLRTATEMLKMEGKVEEALERSFESFALHRTHKPDSTELLHVMNTHCYLLAYTDAKAEVLDLRREMLALVRRAHARSPSPATERIMFVEMNMMARAVSPFDPGEALTLCREAAAGLKRVCGLEDHEAHEAQSHLAELLVTSAAYAEAEPLLREVIAAQKRAHGDTSYCALASQHTYAELLRETGRTKESMALEKKVLQQRKALLGPTHMAVTDSLITIAKMMQAEGDAKGAIPMLQEVARIRRQLLGPGNSLTWRAVYRVAEAYEQAGQPERARPFARDALTGLRETASPHDDVFLLALEMCARHIAASGDAATARAMQRDATRLRAERDVMMAATRRHVGLGVM